MVNPECPMMSIGNVGMKYLVTNREMMAKVPQFVKQKIVTTLCMVGLAPRIRNIVWIVSKKTQFVVYLQQYVYNEASFYL
jgi:putative exporter of polyketide antibiotics